MSNPIPHEEQVIETVRRFATAKHDSCVLVRIEMLGEAGVLRLLDFRPQEEVILPASDVSTFPQSSELDVCG